MWDWCSHPVLSCMTTTALVSTWDALASMIVGVSPLIGDTAGWGRPGLQEALMSCRLSLDHKCSVFYAAPTKSQLLATLCSGDVCQCAEGERRPRLGARGIGWEGKLVSCDTFLQGSALDC